MNLHIILKEDRYVKSGKEISLGQKNEIEGNFHEFTLNLYKVEIWDRDEIETSPIGFILVNRNKRYVASPFPQFV